jgi:hypothetical protein
MLRLTTESEGLWSPDPSESGSRVQLCTHWTLSFRAAGRGVLHPRFARVDENCLVCGPVVKTHVAATNRRTVKLSLGA